MTSAVPLPPEPRLRSLALRPSARRALVRGGSRLPATDQPHSPHAIAFVVAGVALAAMFLGATFLPPARALETNVSVAGPTLLFLPGLIVGLPALAALHSP